MQDDFHDKIIDIIQVAQKQKELQARFKELEKQEQVWTYQQSLFSMSGI